MLIAVNYQFKVLKTFVGNKRNFSDKVYILQNAFYLRSRSTKLLIVIGLHDDNYSRDLRKCLILRTAERL